MDYIVCGWYTPDYERWLSPLTESLDKLGAPHDFVRVEKQRGSWERATLRKPGMLARAMERHPDQVIVFLDVDAVVLEPLDQLANIDADMAIHLVAKRKSNGNNSLYARSGTIVVRPTALARQFVDNWCRLSRAAPIGWVDQSTMLEALWCTSGLRVAQLDARYCATLKDGVAEPIILHHQGSASARKIPPWLRTLLGATRISPA